MRHYLLAAVATAAIAATAPAHATLQIAGSFNGASLFCADNTGCDLNSSPGVLQLGNQTLGGVEVNGSVQIQSTANGQNLLDTSSLSVVNDNGFAVPVRVTVSGTSFLPIATTAQLTGSGTWVNAVGSFTTYTWFNDPGNEQGADFAGDAPGTQLDTFTTNATTTAQSFSHDNTVPVSDTGPFSMTLDSNGNLSAGATLLNRGQAEIKDQQAVTEPASLAVLGIALLGFGVVRHRSKRSDGSAMAASA